MATLTDRIVDDLYTVATLTPDDRDIKFCRERIADYLGVTYAGARLLVEEHGALIASHSGVGPVPLVGRGNNTDPLTAALCNGMSAHAAELDDGERYGMVHPGAPVISAILSAAFGAAPRTYVDSTILWRAILAGYESTLRLARWLQPQLKERGHHASGVCGTIGAAMGVATLLSLSREETKTAFSAAVTSAAGSLKVIRGRSQLKPYNTGQAAMSGYSAALVARSGLCGPEDVLEGKQGFPQMITGIAGEELIARWPTENRLAQRIYVKPYAACRHCHAPMEAALTLRGKHGLVLENIESVTVKTHHYAVHLHDHTDIPNPASGKMSIPYSVAAALVTGEGGMAAFSPERINMRTIQNLTRRVSVDEDADMTSRVPAQRMARVTIRLGDGREVSETVALPKGEPETPLDSKEMDGKFLDLLEFAGRPRAYAKQLLQRINQLDGELTSFRSLLISEPM